MSFLLKFYRIESYKDKFSWLKFLLVPVLGYVTSNNYNLYLILLNLLGVFLIFSHIYSINIISDFINEKEKNILYEQIKKGETTLKKAVFLSILPLAILPIFLIFNKTTLYLTLSFLIIADLYSLKPVRLKDRFFGSVFTVPICSLILYLQGVSLLSNINLNHVFFSIIILLFMAFGESIHKLYHKGIDKTLQKLGKRKFVLVIKSFFWVSFFISLAFCFYNLIFLVSVFFSFLRMVNAGFNEKTNFYEYRKKFFTKSFSIEFIFYLVFGFLGWFY